MQETLQEHLIKRQDPKRQLAYNKGPKIINKAILEITQAPLKIKKRTTHQPWIKDRKTTN